MRHGLTSACHTMTTTVSVCHVRLWYYYTQWRQQCQSATYDYDTTTHNDDNNVSLPSTTMILLHTMMTTMSVCPVRLWYYYTQWQQCQSAQYDYDTTTHNDDDNISLPSTTMILLHTMTTMSVCPVRLWYYYTQWRQCQSATYDYDTITHNDNNVSLPSTTMILLHTMTTMSVCHVRLWYYYTQW